MKVAIVGSGISGLAAAHRLSGNAAITLFEADARFGGHAHTVDISLPGANGDIRHGVDTGFLVFNERTYPGLIQLFAELGVETVKSDMSFSVQVGQAKRERQLEWSGSSLNTVFAQRSNLLRPRFLGMLSDLLRFNALTARIAASGTEGALEQPLAEFLREHRFGDAFRDWYFLPMMACIWSCPTEQMLQFPVATMIRFCHNHGLNQISQRPQWWTVRGGSRTYVDKIVAGIGDRRSRTPVRWIAPDADGVALGHDGGVEHFDRVIVATHSDQALALLRSPTTTQRKVLGAIRYQANRAVLHTDSSVLPGRRAAWAAWNYQRAAPSDTGNGAGPQVCLHYLINRLQPLPWAQPVVVSLNPLRDIAPRQVMGDFAYAHPVFDLAAISAQRELAKLHGESGIYFCGAWTGYGFHEDGLQSGEAVARQIMATQPARPVVPA